MWLSGDVKNQVWKWGRYLVFAVYSLMSRTIKF